MNTKETLAKDSLVLLYGDFVPVTSTQCIHLKLVEYQYKDGALHHELYGLPLMVVVIRSQILLLKSK